MSGKKTWRCDLCGQMSMPGVKLGEWSAVRITRPVKLNLHFCPGHTAKEIADYIGHRIQGVCKRTDCETSPWDCKLPEERMNEECLRDIDKDLKREHLEEDQQDPEDCCPDLL